METRWWIVCVFGFVISVHFAVLFRDARYANLPKDKGGYYANVFNDRSRYCCVFKTRPCTGMSVCLRDDGSGNILTEQDLVNEPDAGRLLWWSFAALVTFVLGVAFPFNGLSPVLVGASVYILAVHADGTHFLSPDPSKLPKVF